MRLHEIFDDQAANSADRTTTGIPREFMSAAWHQKQIEKIMAENGGTILDAIAEHEQNWKQYLKGIRNGFMSLNELAGLGASVMMSGAATDSNTMAIAGLALVYVLTVKLTRGPRDNHHIRAVKKKVLQELKNRLAERKTGGQTG